MSRSRKPMAPSASAAGTTRHMWARTRTIPRSASAAAPCLKKLTARDRGLGKRDKLVLYPRARDINPYCHPERSEGPMLAAAKYTGPPLRLAQAQDDNLNLCREVTGRDTK